MTRYQKTLSLTVDQETLDLLDELDFTLRQQLGIRGRSAVVRYLVRDKARALRSANTRRKNSLQESETTA